MATDKILLQDIAEGLAARNGITKKEADAFVRTLFEAIEECLVSEQLVKIKGLGTFKLVTVDSRESINVNTGERFTINSHSKVSFVPEKALSERINRPFADFEAVILNEKTLTEDMERIVETEQIADLIEVESAEIEEPVAEEGKTTVETITEPEPIAIESTPTTEVEDENDTEEAEEGEIESVKEEEEEPQQIEQISTESTPETTVEEKKEETVNIIEAEPESTDTVVSQKPEEIEAEKECPLPPPQSWKQQKGNKCLIYILILLNALLLIWWLSFSYLNKEMPASTPQETIRTEVATDNKVTLPDDSIKKVQETEKEVDIESLIAAHPQVEYGDYWIIGTKSVHRIERGDDLSKLAQEYYGNKQLISYILKYNGYSLSKANNLPIGAEVKIPELRERQSTK